MLALQTTALVPSKLDNQPSALAEPNPIHATHEAPIAPVADLTNLEAKPAQQNITWQQLMKNGKLSFASADATHDETYKEYQEMIDNGLGYAIQDMIDDPKLGKKFLKEVEEKGLTISVDAEVNSYTPKENHLTLNLNKNTDISYLDVESGKLLPISKHRMAIHEMVHFVHDADKGKIGELIQYGFRASHEETRAVQHADRIMEKYDEPNRTVYLMATDMFKISTSDYQPTLDYYQPGESFTDKIDVSQLEQDRAIYPALYGMVVKDKQEKGVFSNSEQNYVKDATQHFRNYLAKHEPEKLEEFDQFIELKQAIIKADKNGMLSEKEWKKMQELDIKSQEVSADFKPRKAFPSYGTVELSSSTESLHYKKMMEHKLGIER